MADGTISTKREAKAEANASNTADYFKRIVLCVTTGGL